MSLINYFIFLFYTSFTKYSIVIERLWLYAQKNIQQAVLL